MHNYFVLLHFATSSLHFACVDVDTATCSDCASGTCPNPILPYILKEKKLTSGYMGIFSSAKPKGISDITKLYLNRYLNTWEQIDMRLSEACDHQQ